MRKKKVSSAREKYGKCKGRVRQVKGKSMASEREENGKCKGRVRQVQRKITTGAMQLQESGYFFHIRAGGFKAFAIA